MLHVELHEAVVIPFPSPARWGNRLTVRDRIAVLGWTDAARRSGYDRVVISERRPEDDPQFGDVLSLYRAGECWAAWGIARQGDAVRVWHCGSGADLGDFPTVETALAAIEAAPPCGGPAGQEPQCLTQCRSPGRVEADPPPRITPPRGTVAAAGARIRRR